MLVDIIIVSKNAKLQLCIWGEMSLAGFWKSLNYLNGMFFSLISPWLFSLVSFKFLLKYHLISEAFPDCFT